MCLVIAVLSLAFAVNFLLQGKMLLGLVSTVVGLFFVVIMIRNIRKRLKEKKI
jgi:hypothetical protein